MAQLRTIICRAVGLSASAVLASPAAATVGERLIFDGCEVGGGGNDIHSLHSRYDAERNEIAVTVRLCSATPPNAIYRVHLDHAVPFVGEAATPLVAEVTAPATCAALADSVVARRPGGHEGVGTSEVEGNLIRFIVPLDDLDVGEPDDAPLIPLWATSKLGGTVDHAPNRETGDDCAHPQARTETLVQPRALTGDVAFLTSATFSGFIGGTAAAAIQLANSVCQQEARNAGMIDTDSIIAWLANSAGTPDFIAPPAIGPIQTADGTTIANNMADLLSCNPDGSNDCLLAPIDKDINGNQVDLTEPAFHMRWTGAGPAGQIDPTGNCNDWTSAAADDIGTGGTLVARNAGWTIGLEDSCDQTHPVICFQTDVLVSDR